MMFSDLALHGKGALTMSPSEGPSSRDHGVTPGCGQDKTLSNLLYLLPGSLFGRLGVVCQ